MKFSSLLVAFVIAASVAFTASAHAAQTVVTMPVLYNASGQAVNTSGGTLAAGTYYLNTNATHPVNYFGDGSYFDPANASYGGSIYHANGQAGTFVVEVIPEVQAPGVPNTGMGGDAAKAWTTLAVAALAALGGATFLARRGYAAK